MPNFQTGVLLLLFLFPTNSAVQIVFGFLKFISKLPLVEEEGRSSCG